MRVLITGICGFVGSTLAKGLLDHGHTVLGVDSLVRPGAELNRLELRTRGIRVLHGDLRLESDVADLPPADAVIDAAANPSVLAGVDGSGSKGVFDHNLTSTIHLLEYCKRHRAAFVLISTSRVYSIPALAGLAVTARNGAFVPTAPFPPGMSDRGLSEDFSTAAPISLYGASKLASEAIALEYGLAFDFPVWIDRCGVLAGAGQFGRPDQGIFAYWINAYLRRRPLKYIGFDGLGSQSRDALHPLDLLPVIRKQLEGDFRTDRPIYNLGGGPGNLMSLAQLTAYCRARFGFDHPVATDPTPRLFDIPWMAMDSARAAHDFAFRPARTVTALCDEIAAHAEAHPNWLELSAAL